MTLTRKLIIAFWVFIVIMLAWQLYSCNQSITQQAVEHPQQEHFFYYQSNGASATPPSKPEFHGPALEQIAFVVQPDKPNPGSFTCLVTIKNIGTAKATDIQVCVRPFRGIMNKDEDVYHDVLKPIDDNSQLAQISQWVSFPDLGPGETSTQSCSFLNSPGVKPGHNPRPEIDFQPEKTQQEIKPQDVKPRQAAPSQ